MSFDISNLTKHHSTVIAHMLGRPIMEEHVRCECLSGQECAPAAQDPAPERTFTDRAAPKLVCSM
jgi:hypothetical protein